MTPRPHRHRNVSGVLAALLFSAAQADSGALPQQFEARIGGFLSGHTQVTLKGTQLEYTRYKADRTLAERSSITPSQAQWRQFRQALQRAGVCTWQDRYVNEQVLDGTQWSLRWQDGYCQVNVVGSNSYPDAQGRDKRQPEYTPAFTRYLKAVEALLSHQTPRIFR